MALSLPWTIALNLREFPSSAFVLCISKRPTNSIFLVHLIWPGGGGVNLRRNNRIRKYGVLLFQHYLSIKSHRNTKYESTLYTGRK